MELDFIHPTNIARAIALHAIAQSLEWKRLVTIAVSDDMRPLVRAHLFSECLCQSREIYYGEEESWRVSTN